jgi:hypothetical protein
MITSETFTLEYPVDVKAADGSITQVTSVTLRRMKARDLKHIKVNEDESTRDGAVMLPLVAVLTDLPLTVVEDIDMADMKKILDKLAFFSSGFLGTGKKSSGESQQPITSPPI